MMRVALPGLLVACVACGARSDLDPLRESGAGGADTSSATASTTASTSTGAGAGGAAPACNAFVVDGEPYAIPVGMNATEPRVGTLGAASFVAFRTQDGFLSADASLSPESVWPDPFDAIAQLVPNAGPFVTGPGPAGPVAAMRRADSLLTLVPTLSPAPQAEALFPISGPVHFVASSSDRSLLAFEDAGALQVIGVEAGGFISTEEPQVCLATNHLARVVAQGESFVAAYADSVAPGQSCFGQVVPPGLSLMVRRYDPSPKGPASVITEALLQREPLLHLGLERTGFGSWLVYQTDGSISLTMPPILALRLDTQGVRLPSSQDPIALTPSGIATSVLATATMGDALVIAWVDAIDPSSPSVVVQRIEADGTPGPSTSFPTSAAWLTGGLVMTATPDRANLLLAWTADFDKTVGVAKISCR